MNILNIIEIFLFLVLMTGWIIRIKKTQIVKESIFKKIVIFCLHGLEVLQLLLLFGALQIFLGTPCAGTAPTEACGDIVGLISIPVLFFASFIVGLLCFAGYGYFIKNNHFDVMGILFLIFYASPLLVFAFFFSGFTDWINCTVRQMPWYCH
jgi:hypothetical protein